MKNIKYYEKLIEKSLNKNEFVTSKTANNDLIPPKSKKLKKAASNTNQTELLISIYQLLVLNFKKYSSKWNFSNLINLLNESKQDQDSNSELKKWLILKISSLLLNLSPLNEKKLFRSYFDSNKLNILEQKIHDLCQKECLFNSASSYYIKQHESESGSDDQEDKFYKFEKLKLKKNKSNENLKLESNQIILVETTKKNLNKLVMSILSDTCLVLEGNLSSGKTSLIEYLSSKTNNCLIKYQMDEFMDSKSLIGNYICSDIPGEFVWKPGPLYQAVSEGKWILLEDFDHSPVDTLSLIIDLLETKSIKTCDNIIHIKPNFRLFLTLRPSDGRRVNPAFIENIKKLSRFIILQDLTDSEIIKIIKHKYPIFSKHDSNKICDKLLSIFKLLDYSCPIEINSDGFFINIRDNRLLSLRDLTKLCNRVSKSIKNLNDIDQVYNLFNDVNDCFLSFASNKKSRLEIACKIGAQLNINRDQVYNLLINNKSNFYKTDKIIECGRVRLKLDDKIDHDLAQINFGTKFVYTKNSLSLLEKIARAIECNEPVLLCGETGVGKTTSLQHLAKLLGKKISVLNLNQQTETSDLLGSFKPVDIKIQMKFIKEKFLNLFSKCFNVDENQTFLNHVQACYSSSNWKYLTRLVSHASDSAYKKYKLENKSEILIKEWYNFKHIIEKIEQNLEDLIKKFSFQFFDGKLSQAIVNGEWIILDEINLASSETLQFLGALLEDSANSSITLYEKGDNEPLKRHCEFRLFAAMNPASDIGKRNLPSNIRSRFTEIFVDELDDENDLTLLIKSYLESLPDLSKDVINSIVHFYLTVRDEVFLKKLSNGTGMPPVFSLRTLCRALKNASKNSCNNSILSIYDSLCLSFLTDLNRESSLFLEDFIKTTILKSSKLKGKIQRVKPGTEIYNDPYSMRTISLNYTFIEDYWILKGPNECEQDPGFIFTKSAKDNLKRLARVCSARLPCLIQGDTSIGKTSLIKWLAKSTGNVLIRINNHDHTDLQEYIGSYILDHNSKLVFKEGLLVQAMKKGYWILLDELNLASSEVLEALNRVLDDNRELYIPETQELVRAHPRFLLFATQNPPGKYAGRKQLSRAFRNRFIELHYDELPEDELQLIVEQKCKLPKTYSELLIKTIKELKTKRSQVSGIFLGKNSLITLRDLFRWARRYSEANDMDSGNVDWKQYLAEQGFLLLSSRCRSEQDVETIHSCIEKSFNKKIEISNLNDPRTLCRPIMSILEGLIKHSEEKFKNFVWTPNARRVALLTGLAYKFNEPFLLVGETGVGKTTICQILSSLNDKNLNIINCHMHSEASDFLGSIRPVRESGSNKEDGLFEWKDGPLVIALKNGEDLLIDEISLADDSVLERLNSVLEEEKTLLLAENINENSHSIKASDRFRIFSTMNPSGDFGKKELSAALRNRFTEIWCPAPSIETDEFRVISEKCLLIDNLEIKNNMIELIVVFLRWLNKQIFFKKLTFSIRDLTNWIYFINKTMQDLNPYVSLIHGACLVFIDSLSSEINLGVDKPPRDLCLEYLFTSAEEMFGLNLKEEFYSNLYKIENNENSFKCGPFMLKKGDFKTQTNFNYCFDSYTTCSNLQRVMRCLLMNNPIMLEGSPGVGKTSLVESLAKITNNKIVRINLSEQTDLNELFGADLPAPSDTDHQQKFIWHDGPFLLALKQGYWVILDEINLASQSVLEGLNSCFDHRNEIYISELNKRFFINPSRTKIFACQNPFSQGGGRKGLPKSFLNRFSKVYVDQMSQKDLLFICKNLYPIQEDWLNKMIIFNEKINEEVCLNKTWGTLGSPWEFNLRDLFRWCDLLMKNKSQPGDYIYLIYENRFRTRQDKVRVYKLFEEIFGFEAYKQEEAITVRLSDTHTQIGQSFFMYETKLNAEQAGFKSYLSKLTQYSFTNKNLKYLESILKCIEMNWMVILVGKSSTGKTSLVRLLSNLVEKNLIEFSVNNSTDTSDLLGGFEKVKHLKQLLEQMNNKIKSIYLQKSLSNSSFLKLYLNYVYESKSLFKNLINLDQESELVLKMMEFFKKNIKTLGNEASNLYDELKTIENLFNKDKKLKEKMKFEWIDSSLVKAIENGDWVLIDNANFCVPSVLDRLNPLLEKNGILQINEKGIQQDGKLVQIKQNENFRLILSMNETLGELSRPMRNRGVEIYLEELDPIEDIEDVFIILKTLFPFSNDLEVFNQIYSKVTGLSFIDIFKLFKLTNDYYKLENLSLTDSFQKALIDTNLNPMIGLNLSNNQKLNHNFNSNCFLMKQFKIEQFLFNFPIYLYFKNQLKNFFTSMKSIEIQNLSKNAIKISNLMSLFIKNLPLSNFKMIILNDLRSSFTNSSDLDNLLESYFKYEQFFKEYETRFEEIGSKFGFDLSNEIIDLNSNLYLLNKLQDLEQVKLLNDMLNYVLQFEGFNYRLKYVYKIKLDSLLSQIQRGENKNFNFLLLMGDFFSLFESSCLNNLKLEAKNEQLQDLFVSILFLLEKFYLILVDSFDSLFTLNYLKYYWNFIHCKLNQLEQIVPDIYSIEFKSISNLFNENLYFDDTIYKIYYNLWCDDKLDISLSNNLALKAKMNQINEFLIEHNIFSGRSSKKLLNYLNSLLNYEQNKLNELNFTCQNDLDLIYNKIENLKINQKNLLEFKDLNKGLNFLLIKCQSIPLEHYLNLINGKYVISNLTDLFSLNSGFKNFYSLLSKTMIKSIEFVDIIQDLLSKNVENDFEISIENELSLTENDRFLNKIQTYSKLNQNCLSLFSYDWLSEYLCKFLLKKNLPNQFINSIDLTLEFYDDIKLNIDKMKSFLWLNYKELKQPASDKMDKDILVYLQSYIEEIKASHFDLNDALIESYLLKKGFNDKLFQLRELNNTKIELLIYGFILVYLYAPIDPLDPLENENLIKKNESDIEECKKNEQYLIELNRSKLKQFKQEPEQVQINFVDRINRSDYFLIKNEFENCLKQFLNYEQICKFVTSEKNQQELKTWLISIDHFIQKISNQFYTHRDVLYKPLNGLTLVSYSLSSFLRPNVNSNLIPLLINYPSLESYGEQAQLINNNSETISNNLLRDEIKLIALINLLNDLINKSKLNLDLSYNKLFLDLCFYFKERYLKHKKEKEQAEILEPYKYKTYGQKEIQEELEEQELRQKCPSYEQNFDEFIQTNKLEDTKVTSQESLKETSKSIDLDLYNQIYDLIDFYSDFDSYKSNSDLIDSVLIKCFYRSYSIGAHLLNEASINEPNKPIFAHILFTSSLNLNQDNFKISLKKPFYDIYHDSNYEQVLLLKKELNLFKNHVEKNLSAWNDNPILIELLKLVSKLETFNLNDPLMKYLTGVELLLSKAENWQQISSKEFSLEQELRELNQLVVEWRKMELKYWLSSIDMELDRIRKETGFNWFFTIYSVCEEFTNTTMSSNDLMSNLIKFIETSSIGEYFIRLRNIKLCFNIFNKFSGEHKRFNLLAECLWSVYDFYERLYSDLIRQEIETNRKQIENELKDFIQIYKWQDANYWSLKNSINKSTKTLFRVLKKFKYYLREALEFDKLTSRIVLMKSDNKYLISNFKIALNTEDLYSKKMVKLCNKVLILNFRKNLLNSSYETYYKNIEERFDQLNSDSSTLLSKFNSSEKKTKELNSKFKKDFKFINQQKLKLVSDLIKDLTSMGLSYRRGLVLDQAGFKLEDLIRAPNLDFENYPDYLKAGLNQFKSNFYLAVNKFIKFKLTVPSQASSNLPNEKFLGFINHLGYILNKQNAFINSTLVKLAPFKILLRDLELIVSAQTPDSCFKQNSILFQNWLVFVEQTGKLISEINQFYETSKIDSNLIKIDFNLSTSGGNKYQEGSLESLMDKFKIKDLEQLKFGPEFEDYLNNLQTYKLQVPANSEKLKNPDENLLKKLGLKCLKSVENLFKKYSTCNKNLNFEATNNILIEQYLNNFEQDLGLFNLNKLLSGLKKALSFTTINELDRLKFLQLESYLRIYEVFISKYLSYFVDSSLKTSQFLLILIKIFDELKQKGLQIPKELEQDDSSEGNEGESNENKKFETDDAAGLGDGQGSKDVSDQIETEDQLDDAKTKEQREEDKNAESEEEEELKEEKNGIEMSEDFDAEMNDVEQDEKEEEKQESEKDKEEEEEEELDDQKGDVDTPEDFLDNQLWDEKDENEEDPNLDEDIQGGEKLNDDKSDLLAKQEELPMIDNEENKDGSNSGPEDNEEPMPDDFEMNEVDQEKTKEPEDQKPEDEEPSELQEQEEVKDSESSEEKEPETESGEPEPEKIEPEQTDAETAPENQEQSESDLNKSTKNYDQNKNSKNESDSNTKNANSEAAIEEEEENENEKAENNENNEATFNESSKNELKTGQTNEIKDLNDTQAQTEEKNKRKLGTKNENRVLDQEQSLNQIEKNKNAELIDMDQQNESESDKNNETNSDQFRHIKNESETYDSKMYDAATESQKGKRDIDELEQDQMDLDQEPESEEMEQSNKNINDNQLKPEEAVLKQEQKKSASEKEKLKKEALNQADSVQTQNLERPNDSLFETKTEILNITPTRDQVEKDLAKFKLITNQDSLSQESIKLWLEYETITQQLSKELCEQLRLILEPTICSKLKGDYKTGKRLNMKRVVEYIATEYRKDKIWLRRTKPNKRDYKVLLSVDNSSSMSDNHCMQLAYETIATLLNAFNYLEVGEFGLVSFGDKVEQLHGLGEQFNTDVGARVLNGINFKHDRTKIAEMLDESINLFNQTSSTTSNMKNLPVSKLLIILSDGRGVFYEGMEKVKNSVQKALQEGIFIVFVILDITRNNLNKNSSIFDIKMPVYTPGNPIPMIKSYMENFPFPFYIVLREVNSLPHILMEALKQWFEMVTKIEA